MNLNTRKIRTGGTKFRAINEKQTSETSFTCFCERNNLEKFQFCGVCKETDTLMHTGLKIKMAQTYYQDI